MVATPYGLRDIKITPYLDSAATSLGEQIDLPYAQTLTFSESEDFDDLRGDDKLVTTHGQGPTGSWELGAGGISLEAVAAITGANLETTGADEEEVTTLTKNTSDIRPWFQIEGQAISDSGGDFHVVLPRCRMTDTMDGELSDGTFFITSCKGMFLGSAQDGVEGELWKFVQNTTKTDISAGDGGGTG